MRRIRILQHAIGRAARFIRDSRAATSVEYGLIAVLIVIAMIAALQNLAGTTIGVWNNVSTKVANAN